MGTATDDCSEAPPDYLDDRARTYYRAVLQYFRRQQTEVATVENLVTFVRDRDRSDRDDDHVAIHLHHATLPRLADAGCIDYDAERNTVRYRGPPPEDR